MVTYIHNYLLPSLSLLLSLPPSLPPSLSPPSFSLPPSPSFLPLPSLLLSPSLPPSLSLSPHHNDGFKTVDKVFVRLPLGVAIVVLVLVPHGKLLGIFILYLLISQCLTFTLESRTAEIKGSALQLGPGTGNFVW